MDLIIFFKMFFESHSLSTHKMVSYMQHWSCETDLKTKQKEHKIDKVKVRQ